ncbi:transposase [Paenibacillus sp. MBLB4367]|uniref:transposase n=1 Tax=Paenibacillus sp. MBLB4367 TaxID=3384767 RepID=UPI0039082709
MKSTTIYDEMRIKVAQEALGGTRVAYLARKYSVTPKTIHNWVKFYKERYGDEAVLSVEERISDSKRVQELENKYEKAVKLLGEKDLEIEILRDLVKKTNPAYKTKSK